jgi:putative ABC transport system permease protein
MTWIALRMLFGDRGKFGGIIVGITFGALLISQQCAIFCGLMIRTYSQIKDIRDADIWVMDPNVEFVEELKPLADRDLHRVRGVAGVDWAVRLFKGLGRARVPSGALQQVVMLGLDDDSLVGAPVEMLLGRVEDMRRPDAVLVDDAGYVQLWPGEPLEVGKVFEMNDRRAVVVGVFRALRTFQTVPLVYTRYSQAMHFAPQERRTMTYVLARAKPGLTPGEVCARISEQTGLQALTSQEFAWKTLWFFMSTGIPFNFAFTVFLGFLVGTAIAGQTFYMFTLDNLKQFAMLKAMGTTHAKLTGMIALQAAVSGFIGFGLGIGPTAIFGNAIGNDPKLAFYMPWQVLAGTGVAVIFMLMFSSVMSIRRVLRIEPAVVFQS